MSDFIRVSGRTVDDAIMNAAIALGTSSDNIEYTIIERESKGFLGIGAKDALVEARRKTPDEDLDLDFAKVAREPESIKAELKVEEAVSQKPEEEMRKKAEVPKAETQKDEEAKTEAPRTETPKASPKKEGHSRKASREGGKKASQKNSAQKAGSGVDVEMTDTVERARQKRNSDIKPLDDPSEAIERAEGFLRDVYAAMGMKVELSSNYDGEVLNVKMDGEEMGLLIGKRGQTLDSLQYLTSLVVNKGKPYYVRVKLDTENYRERRKATLENLAKNIAIKVKKTRQPVALEPMNPYERRIIHSALQDDPFVTTHSEGEEPDRKVVVTLKKDADLDALERKYGERRSMRGSYRSSRGGRGGYGQRGGRSAGRSGYGRKRYEDYGDRENSFYGREESERTENFEGNSENFTTEE